jgi:hypothetical protein
MNTLFPLCLAVAAISAQAHPCAEIADPSARLSCYDRQFPPSATPLSATSPPAAAAKSEAQLRFGLPPDRKAEPVQPEALNATLGAVEFRADGMRLFTLDNGQRWLETDSQRRGVAVAGDRIEIRRASFGSFMLITTARVGIRVRRMQ